MIKYTATLKRSKQPRKQRAYVYKAPLHVRQQLAGAHLSSDLRKKYGRRSIGLRVKDKVVVMRGSSKGNKGAVERIDLRKSIAYIQGIERTKIDGSKAQIPVKISNLQITDLALDDKERKKILDRKGSDVAQKASPKKSQSAEEKK